jgi:SAM-dependent methyltransferase
MSPRLPWCQECEARRVYSGPIRDGKFGQQTAANYDVWELAATRLRYLHPFPPVDYTDDSYRVAVNDSAAIEQYFKIHAAQQPGYLELLRPHLRSEQKVADIGCGGGALLDLVKAETRGATMAIEPFTGYHRSLAERGHAVFATAAAALAAGHGGGIDLALSFHVIEHTIDPVEYLAEIRKLVRPGGLLFVLTPNVDDFLMQADPPRMEPFFYRRVHNYYFSAESLAWTAARAGWKAEREVFYHEFGLANALLWLRDGRPSGHTPLAGVDGKADAFWRTYLERNRQANNVGVLLSNPA